MAEVSPHKDINNINFSQTFCDVSQTQPILIFASSRARLDRIPLKLISSPRLQDHTELGKGLLGG